MLSSVEKKHWPNSRKIIDQKIYKNLGTFWSRVTRRVFIDLSHLGLASLQKPILFKFIDPVYAWAACANKLSGEHPLYFKYKPRRHPTHGNLMYGASVQNGEILQRSCARVPDRERAGPALFGLSWDAGNASKRRSYTPMVISVGNTDYCGLHACTCIAYMPKLPLASKELSSDEGLNARHELTQACATAILDVVEKCAKDGFKCILGGEEWWLFPVMARMEFDTKERYKFFGCARERACGIGSGPRKGHSALRTCTSHDSRTDLARKRKIISGEIPENKIRIELAEESLRRRGLHPRHQCTSLQGL